MQMKPFENRTIWSIFLMSSFGVPTILNKLLQSRRPKKIQKYESTNVTVVLHIRTNLNELVLTFLVLEVVLDLVLKFFGDSVEVVLVSLGISCGKDAPLIDELKLQTICEGSSK